MQCCKWYHCECVGFEAPEDWRDGWVCPECTDLAEEKMVEGDEEVVILASETEESDESIVEVLMRKRKGKRGGGKATR